MVNARCMWHSGGKVSYRKEQSTQGVILYAMAPVWCEQCVVGSSGRRRRACSLMCSRSAGAVTISRQRTMMLCCLMRTLLSPALCDHHGSASLTHGGLCVSSAAGANEFWTAVWDWTCVFGPPKPRKRVTWWRRQRLNPEVFKQTKKKVAHGAVPAPHTLKLAS